MFDGIVHIQISPVSSYMFLYVLWCESKYMYVYEQTKRLPFYKDYEIHGKAYIAFIKNDVYRSVLLEAAAKASDGGQEGKRVLASVSASWAKWRIGTVLKSSRSLVFG